MDFETQLIRLFASYFTTLYYL